MHVGEGDGGGEAHGHPLNAGEHGGRGIDGSMAMCGSASSVGGEIETRGGLGELGFDQEGGATSSRHWEGRDGRHVADPAKIGRAHV